MTDELFLNSLNETLKEYNTPRKVYSTYNEGNITLYNEGSKWITYLGIDGRPLLKTEFDTCYEACVHSIVLCTNGKSDFDSCMNHFVFTSDKKKKELEEDTLVLSKTKKDFE